MNVYMYESMHDTKCSEILIPKSFPKGLSFIYAKLSYIRSNKTFDLNKWIPSLIQKFLRAFGPLVDPIAFTSFNHFHCFDHYIVEPSNLMLEHTTTILCIVFLKSLPSYQNLLLVFFFECRSVLFLLIQHLPQILD